MKTNKQTILSKGSITSPGIPALIYLLLFVVGMVMSQIGTSGAAYPTPYEAVEKAQAYYGNFGNILRIYSLFIFCSALSLGIFTVFVTNRLKLICDNFRGSGIVNFGGYTAAVFIAISALCTWVLTHPDIPSEAGITRAIQLLGFAAGGTGNLAATGLLIAGISRTAGIAGIISKWVMWSGLVLTVISLLSVFNMVFPKVSFLLPLGRFFGMIWMVITGFAISKYEHT